MPSRAPVSFVLRFVCWLAFLSLGARVLFRLLPRSALSSRAPLGFDFLFLPIPFLLSYPCWFDGRVAERHASPCLVSLVLVWGGIPRCRKSDRHPPSPLSLSPMGGARPPLGSSARWTPVGWERTKGSTPPGCSAGDGTRSPNISLVHGEFDRPRPSIPQRKESRDNDPPSHLGDTNPPCLPRANTGGPSSDGVNGALPETDLG